MSHWSGGPRSVEVRKAVASLPVLQGDSAGRTCGTECHPHCLPPSSARKGLCYPGLFKTFGSHYGH